MGLINWLFTGQARPDYLATPVSGIVSPWQPAPTNLEAIAASEIFGPELAAPSSVLSREQALQIPAVAKGRHLIIAAIANLPLRAYGADSTDPLPNQPTFLYRTDTDLDEAQPYSRLVATIDDLLFYGRSLWLVQRGATGNIIEAAWTPVTSYRTDGTDVWLGQENDPLNRRDFILFHTPLYPGLLTAGAVTLRGARDTEAAWTARMETPTPILEYKITTTEYTSQDEHELFAAEWYRKHRSGQPAFSITPAGAEIRTHGGQGEAELFLENRNAIRLDVAAFWNIPAVLMDGSLSTASLTYTTQEGSRNLFYDQTLPLWTAPIEAALSKDAVVPRGQRVRFDRSELYAAPTPTGAPVED